jgi:hypothetical protein
LCLKAHNGSEDIKTAVQKTNPKILNPNPKINQGKHNSQLAKNLNLLLVQYMAGHKSVCSTELNQANKSDNSQSKLEKGYPLNDN